MLVVLIPNFMRHFTVDWNLFAREFFCKFLKLQQNTIAKNFNGFIIVTVVGRNELL